MHELTLFYIASFAGLFYLSLYLSGKLHIMDKRGEVWKTIIVIAPCLAATLIAVSRIMDARHHPFDVITGSLLGVFTAWASYRQYFPPLSEPWKKGRAYPIRSWGTQPAAPLETAYLRATDNDDTVPLRDMTGEQIYARGQPSGTSPNLSDRSLSQQQQGPPAVVGAKTRHRDSYSSSSSEDEAADYEMTSPRHGRRPGITPPPAAAASYQPYDTTAYYSPGRSLSPSNVENGRGQRHLAGEV